MKKKLILKKIKIAALNEQEQQQVHGGSPISIGNKPCGLTNHTCTKC